VDGIAVIQAGSVTPALCCIFSSCLDTRVLRRHQTWIPSLNHKLGGVPSSQEQPNSASGGFADTGHHDQYLLTTDWAHYYRVRETSSSVWIKSTVME
jgi:hypothetical protein